MWMWMANGRRTLTQNCQHNVQCGKTTARGVERIRSGMEWQREVGWNRFTIEKTVYGRDIDVFICFFCAVIFFFCLGLRSIEPPAPVPVVAGGESENAAWDDKTYIYLFLFYFVVTFFDAKLMCANADDVNTNKWLHRWWTMLWSAIHYELKALFSI